MPRSYYVRIYNFVSRKTASAIIKLLLIACIYYITGRLGLLLAVPPGYATAMWPPSGFALALLLLLGTRYWPGVWLGSLAVNAFTLFQPGNQTTLLLSSGIAAFVASGASLQAVVSAQWIRRKISWPNPLEQFQEILLLLLIGGPIGCLINATISIGTLTLFGAISLSQAPLSWLTWWIGDAIGVLIFTPVLLLTFSKRTLISNSRKRIVATSLLAIFLLTITGFLIARSMAEKKAQQDFSDQVFDITQKIAHRAEDYQASLEDVGAFFLGSHEVTNQEFDLYTEHLLRRQIGIRTLTWNPRIPHPERISFETSQQQRLSEKSFTVRAFTDEPPKANRARNLKTAPVQIEYFPIAYIAPYNRRLHGFDPYSDLKRRQAMDAARDSGKLTTTSRVSLINLNQSTRYGVLIFLPLYTHQRISSVEDRRKNLKGFITGAVDLPAVFSSVVGENRDIEFRIYDKNAIDPRLKLLYDSNTPDNKEATTSSTLPLHTRILQTTFTFADHEWIIEARQILLPGVAQQNWEVWFVLVGGLLFTGLFGIFVLVVTAQTEVVQRQVAAKTTLLRRSEERFRLLVDNATEYSIVMLDPAGNIASWNPAAQKIKGYSAQEIIGQHFSRFYSDIARAADLPSKNLLLARTYGHIEEEGWRVRKDGTKFWAIVTITALYDDNGDLYGYSKITRDLTERKQSEQRFQRAIEVAPTAILLINNLGKITTINQEALLLFGYEKDEMQNIAVEALIPASIRSRHEQLRKSFDASPTARRMGAGRELLAQRKDGSVFPVEVGLSPIETEQGTHTMVMVLDITERKKQHTLLEQAKETAEATARAKSQFLANMSHEIRTPMNVILGMASLLQSTSLDSQQQEYLQLVQQSGEALLRLLNDILDFSKMEAGKLELSPIDFNIREKFENTIQRSVSLAQQKNLEFLLCIGALPSHAHGDVERLMQVVNNLLSNAIKFTSNGEIEVTVEGEAVGEIITLHVSVRDTGIGIPPDVRDKIFGAFSQADTSTTRRFGGTGLGLTISREIVNLMQGDIWVESEENQGSTFHFYVRLQSNSDTTIEVPLPPLPHRALIVDTNASHLNILQKLCMEWGIKCDTVQTPQLAIQHLQDNLAQDQKYSVILLSYQLDDHNAAQLLRALTEFISEEKLPPYILMTTSRESTESLSSLQPSPFALLQKPIHKLELYDALSKTLPNNSDTISASIASSYTN